MLVLVLVWTIISGLRGQNVQRLVVAQGEPFSFQCQHDQSIYFGRKINDWVEIHEGSDDNLALRFDEQTQNHLVRVSSDAAQAKHVGFYACRKATWSDTVMNSIFELVLADVQSFYWNHICHGAVGSCERVDDPDDENLSRLKVADRTAVEFFCCASVTGIKTVDMHMNQVGETRERVSVNKRQELDGSWVICATQQAMFKRTPYANQQTLTCELLADERRHSTLSSVITVTDAVQPDPSVGYPFNAGDDRKPSNFDRHSEFVGRARRRFSRRRKLAIIVGSIVGGVVLLSMAICLIVCARRKTKTPSRPLTTTPIVAKQYKPVNKSEPPRYLNEDVAGGDEPIYEEPTPLSVKSPVFLRC